jgi:hypothetical protein
LASLAPSLLPSPLELAKHGDYPSKTVLSAAILLTGESLPVSAFFGHRSDPGLPKYALKGDHEKKSHAMNVDWEIA